MLTTRSRPATYADLEALPPNRVGEIVNGALHAHPRPAPRHGIAAGELQAELTGPFRRGRGGPGGWIFIVEPELHLGQNIVVPDLAGWRREKLTPFPTTAWIETPPDWLAEVLSPSTEMLDRGEKLSLYGEHQVGHCWYVEPLARSLEAYALDGTRLRLTRTFRDAEPVIAQPFEVHTFPLDTLWAGL